MEKKNTITIGTGFTGLLTLAFVVLKLCGVIAWSWWWVLAPLWIPLALAIAISIIVLAIYGIILLVAKFQKKK